MEKLFEWLDASTCNVMAVSTIETELKKAGFSELKQEDIWDIQRGGSYYLKKNDSAIFAFRVGTGDMCKHGFRIISAHSDSPCFKLKPNPEIYGDGGVVSLNVEKYGGGIMYTWFDRPLSMSGRVFLRGENTMCPELRLIDFKRPIASIPHLAIHFNRGLNDGNPLSVQKDMKPVIGYYSEEEIATFKKNGGLIRNMIAEELKVAEQEILDYEIVLYPFEKAGYFGVNNQYFQSARIDDLSMAFAGLEALLEESSNSESTRLLAVFDNEETGSGTKQGAASPVLRNLMERIVSIVEGGEIQNFYRAVASSFMISADDAHAWHPNYNEKYDPTNHPVVGGGPVVKINANCKYMTDARGASVFTELCKSAGVKCQYFVNHGDVAGGSTLGNIATSQFDINGVDMGSPIWAMHSARETAGVSDHKDAVKVFREFWK